MLFGIVLVAVSLMRTQCGRVPGPTTGVTFNRSSVSTIVFGMAFLATEVARHAARRAGHTSRRHRRSSSTPHCSPISIAAMVHSCWRMGMLVLGPSYPRADTGCVIAFLQPKTIGQSVNGYKYNWLACGLCSIIGWVAFNMTAIILIIARMRSVIIIQ